MPSGFPFTVHSGRIVSLKPQWAKCLTHSLPSPLLELREDDVLFFCNTCLLDLKSTPCGTQQIDLILAHLSLGDFFIIYLLRLLSSGSLSPSPLPQLPNPHRHDSIIG